MGKIKNSTTIFFILILAIFVSLHVFGLHLPYHQDEYKWKLYSHPEIIPPGSVPHPPLTEFIYTKLGPLVGDNNFRAIPFLFGLVDLFLLYYLVRFLYGEKIALISSFVFTFSFYSLLASLMVDVDGAIMPFFFLLLLIGYFKWREDNFAWSKKNTKWIALLLLGTVGGFFIKVSALLSIAAVFTDYLFYKKVFQDKKKIAKYLVYGLTGLTFLFGVLLLSKFIFPFFNFQYALQYWEHFAELNRGWFQTFIQCVKAVLYSSPLLILSPFLLNKEDLIKTKVFAFFLTYSFIFYVVLFDFSIGALDRYLQLLVLPLTVWTSIVISYVLDSKEKRLREFLLLGCLFSLVVIILQSLPQYVPPLHPKSEWIDRAVSFRWNFLYPFSGGSGPLGFYVSFIVISLSWILIMIPFLISFFKKNFKNLIIVFIIPISIVYNGIFIEEYLFGFYNGHAPTLLNKAIDFIKDNKDIEMVTTYNDNGGNELQDIGKYRKRLYIDPKFDINAKVATLNKYKEHYLVLDVPRIDPESVYMKYFNSCSVIYKDVDRYMSATIYDCRKAPDIKL